MLVRVRETLHGQAIQSWAGPQRGDKLPPHTRRWERRLSGKMTDSLAGRWADLGLEYLQVPELN